MLGNPGKGISAPSEVPSGIAPRLIQSPLESQYRAVPGGSAAECLVPEHAQTCSAGLGVAQDCRSPLFEGCSLLVRFKIFPARGVRLD